MSENVNYTTDEDGIVTARVALAERMTVSGMGKTKEEALSSLIRALDIVSDLAGVK